MKKRRISVKRIAIALIIYFLIGIMSVRLSDSSVGVAKSELAKQLLAEDREYSTTARNILEKSAASPRYAGKNIHVWDSDDTARCDCNTYLGGGHGWRKKGIMIPNRGRDVAYVITNRNDLFFFMHLFGWLWFAMVPTIIIYLFQREESKEIEERIEKRRQQYQK